MVKKQLLRIWFSISCTFAQCPRFHSLLLLLLLQLYERVFPPAVRNSHKIFHSAVSFLYIFFCTIARKTQTTAKYKWMTQSGDETETKNERNKRKMRIQYNGNLAYEWLISFHNCWALQFCFHFTCLFVELWNGIYFFLPPFVAFFLPTWRERFECGSHFLVSQVFPSLMWNINMRYRNSISKTNSNSKCWALNATASVAFCSE